MESNISEAVLRGHPDKLADQIADAVLDDYLKQDRNAHVACEVLVKENHVLLAGEISSSARCLYNPLIRALIEDIGYLDASWGLDSRTCTIESYITEQSPEIAHSLTEGAGDQAIVYGYATDESSSFLPLPYVIAQQLASELSLHPPLNCLRPDGKVLCSMHGPLLDALVLSVQHDESCSLESLRKQLLEYAKSTLSSYIHAKTKFYINPAGTFHIGGPVADSGVTGRKLMVDTYGSLAPHGGGAFSGKDPSKIDRSGAYVARYIAKNIVAAKIAPKCLVKIAYAIGINDPITLAIETFPKSDTTLLEHSVKKHFPLTLNEIIDHFDLSRPIYREFAFGGHFGRPAPWEEIDSKFRL